MMSAGNVVTQRTEKRTGFHYNARRDRFTCLNVEEESKNGIQIYCVSSDACRREEVETLEAVSS
jgi:hypothetical protein